MLLFLLGIANLAFVLLAITLPLLRIGKAIEILTDRLPPPAPPDEYDPEDDLDEGESFEDFDEDEDDSFDKDEHNLGPPEPETENPPKQEA